MAKKPTMPMKKKDMDMPMKKNMPPWMQKDDDEKKKKPAPAKRKK